MNQARPAEPLHRHRGQEERASRPGSELARAGEFAPDINPSLYRKLPYDPEKGFRSRWR